MSLAPGERGPFLVEIALIVVLIFIVLLVIYKLLGPYISEIAETFIRATATTTITPTP
jgi:hypothetical protein